MIRVSIGKTMMLNCIYRIRKFLKGDHGFTLVETLVSMSIFGIVAVVFLIGLSVSSKTLIVSHERVTAENIAKSQMEDTRIQPYLIEATTYPAITLPQDLINESYSVNVDSMPLHTPDDGIQEVTVTVGKDNDVIFTVVDYKISMD